MCIHKGNQDSLAPTVEYLSSLGVLNLRVNAPQTLGVWKEYAEEYALSQDKIWEVYRAFIPWYFEAGMPISLELEGYFSCKKGETAYRVPFAHSLEDKENFDRLYLCESIRHVASSRIKDLVANDPECAQCPHLKACCGGCMVDGVTETGEYARKSMTSCYFHKHIGTAAVRAMASYLQ